MQTNSRGFRAGGTGGSPLLLSGFGGLLFIATFVALGFAVPGYSQLRDAISALEQTAMGPAQQANFFVFGVLQCVFALALGRELASGFGAKLIPIFQALAGAGVMGDAIFLHSAPHMACDLVAFNASMCVLLLFAWRVRKDTRWRGWATYSVATVLAMMAFLFAFGWMNAHVGPAGLMEKLATTVRTLWSVVLAARLFSGVELAPARPTPSQ
ncbi:MAG: DUF998 domain-containing protein [Terracidiphilus sp.]